MKFDINKYNNSQITNNKEDKSMTFEINGTIYKSNDKGNYFYKSTGKTDKKDQPLFMRIGEQIFNKALDEYEQANADKAYEDKKQKQAQSDKEAEKIFNKTKKASKPRKSKDIAFEMDTIIGHVTLTEKQVKFIKLMPKDDFYENGLESALWIDVFCDTVAGEFSPMAVGAMVSTLREKKLIEVAQDKVNGKKCKFMQFTIVGQVVAQKLGLK